MNTITSAPNVINCGNTSIANLKIREQMKDKNKTTGEIFAKLNKRGKLNPKQNAMNYQLTNDQLFRFYCDEVMPKLQQIIYYFLFKIATEVSTAWLTAAAIRPLTATAVRPLTAT